MLGEIGLDLSRRSLRGIAVGGDVMQSGDVLRIGGHGLSELGLDGRDLRIGRGQFQVLDIDGRPQPEKDEADDRVFEQGAGEECGHGQIPGVGIGVAAGTSGIGGRPFGFSHHAVAQPVMMERAPPPKLTALKP